MISVEEEFETFQGGERRDSVIEGCSCVNEEGMGCFNGIQLHVIQGIYVLEEVCKCTCTSMIKGICSLKAIL